MDKQPVFFCVCSQKGSVGKSTITILLASWLHYALGHDVLGVDCDAPQWSIVAQRERELDVLERNDRYKLMIVRLFKRTGRKIWPVVRSTPDEGLQAARAYLAAGDRKADFVLLDLPGIQVQHRVNLVELQNRCPEKHVAVASQKLKVHGNRLDHCMNFRKAEFVVFIHNRDSWLRCKGDNSRPIFFVTYTVTYMKFPCGG